jgi:hypothetical protein
MKTVILQFETLRELAGFGKLVTDRGYVMVIKDLVLQCSLSDQEIQTAVNEFNARILPQNRLAA